MMESGQTIELIRHAAHPLTNRAEEFNELVQQAGQASVVLIGEASHGTHEFYRDRALLTQRLIEEHGFTAVAAEADWPDSYEVNRFVRNQSPAATPQEALEGFQRFPTWMWRNQDVVNFINWLRKYNDQRASDDQKVGFYGLDLYSLFSSIHAVIEYLQQVDPAAAREARRRYGCFDHFHQDLQNYGFMANFGLGKTCEDDVVRQLIDLQQHAMQYAHKDGKKAEEGFFNAEQNARLAKNAEEYYRTMFQGRVESWNLRDMHMAETLNALMDHLSQRRKSQENKIVIWAHNSHIGDARATEMGRIGELNIGQLVRQQFGQKSFHIGFTTFTGTVTAASDWDAHAERKNVREGLPGSYERLFHDVGISDYYLLFREDNQLAVELQAPRLERAIGVIYAPRTERQSHYFDARMAEQFDAVIHHDVTRALEPLEPGDVWHRGEEAPETFPSAL